MMKKIFAATCMLIFLTFGLVVNVVAADRYWVGGTDTWDATAGTKWSITSGGPGGASVPTASDNVFFDANSGNVTVTIAISMQCKNLDFTGFVGVCNSNSAFSPAVYGNLILSSTMTHHGQIYMYGPAAQTITSNNGTIDHLYINPGSQLAKVTLVDDLTVNGRFLFEKGTFNANNKNVTCGNFWSHENTAITSSDTLIMGSGTWTITGYDNQYGSTYAWFVEDVGAGGKVFTLNYNTSTIIFTNSSSSQKTMRQAGRGFTYYNVRFSGTGIGKFTISESNTFNNLKVDAGKTLQFTDGTTQTISSLTAIGTSGNVITITSTTPAGHTLSKSSGTVTVDYCNISYSNAGGGATWNATNSTDGGNNTGWNFHKRYWVGGSGNWDAITTTHWSTTSGGTGGAAVPTATDDVFFDANSGANTVTVNAQSICKNLNFTGFTGTFAGSSFIIEIRGNLILYSGMTWTFSTQIFMNGTVTQTITTNGTVTPINILIGAGSNSNVQLGDDFISTGSSGLQMNSGSFNANNFNITALYFVSNTGSFVSNLTLGSGTWTLSGVDPWRILNATNLTLNANTSTIKCTYSGSVNTTIQGAGKTYNNFWITGTAARTYIIAGSNTFNNFKDDNSVAHTLQFTAGTTNTFTTFNVSGTIGNLITLNSTSSASFTLSQVAGIVNSNYLNISNSTATGGATWNAINSTNGGNNIGWIFGMTPNYPYNPSMDVGNNASNEWSYNGSYHISQITNNFSGELNNYIINHNGNPYNVQVPIKLHSDSAGVLKITNLNIQYLFVDTIKPTISASINPNPVNINSIFTVSAAITDNDAVDSAVVLFNNVSYSMVPTTGDTFSVNILSNNAGIFPVTIIAFDVNGLQHDTIIDLSVNSLGIDLAIDTSDIIITPSILFEGDSGVVDCIIKNIGNTLVNNAEVFLYVDSQIMDAQTVSIPALGQAPVQLNWLAHWAQDTIVIKADPNNLIAESNENNNSGFKPIFVNDPYPPVIIQATATPNPAYVTNQVLFKVNAVDSTGIASVMVNWLGQNVALTYNPLTTFYEGYLNANAIGGNNAIITVQDLNNLFTSSYLSVQVLSNLPDLKIFSSDIQFSPSFEIAGNNASIQVKVINTGNVDVGSANVVLLADGISVGNLSAPVLHDSSAIFIFNWLVSCGNHVFTAIVDSSDIIAEINETNNTAVKAHQFCADITSYQILAQAIPSILSLGGTMSIQATSLPVTPNAFVSVNWNSQNLNMPFDTLSNSYKTSITPTQTGDFLVPVFFTDSNNIQATTYVQFTIVDTLVDLSVNDISTNYPVQSNTNTTFLIEVSNNSLSPVLNSTVYLLSDSQVVDSSQIILLNAFDTVQISLYWQSLFGNHQIMAIIDPLNQISESNESNNSKSIQLTIQDNEPPVIHFINISSPNYQGGAVNIQSYITDNDSIISVIANFQGSDYALQYDTLSSTWRISMSTPINGSFPIGITATDNSSLTAYASSIVEVHDTMPDLEVLAQNIIFTHIDSITNNISAIIQNNGAGAVNGAKVHFAINGVVIDSLLINLSSGQIDTVTFTFNYPIGFHTATISVDPYNQIDESNETNNSATINIYIPDLTPPTSPVVMVNPPSWSASPNFTVSWNQVFDNSGSVTYEYSVNGSVWTNVGTNLSENVTANMEGLNYVYVRAKDSFGNLSELGVGEMKYDNTPPNAPLIAEYHCGTFWTIHDSPYLEWLNPGDVGSGIEYFEVSVDNTPVNIGFNFNHHPSLATGVHTIKVRAVDYVSHIGNWSSDITVYIDLDNPDCPVMQSPTHPDQNAWYQNDSIVLFWNHPAETSSVTGFFYMLNHDTIFFADQTAYWLGKDSLTITTIPSMDTSKIRLPDGIWYIHISSQDSVGHLSTQSCSYRVMIDKTPPFITANYQDTVFACTYTFNLHSEDYTSGVAYTFYRINSGSWISDTIVHLSDTGLNVVEFYSTDLAGNVGEVDSILILLHNNNPISFTITPTSPVNICQNDSVTFIVNSSSMLTYLWSNGANTQAINLTQTGTYSVTVTDSNECSATDSVLLLVNPLPTVVLSNLDSVCIDVSHFVLTGGTPMGGTYNGTGVSGGSFYPAIAGIGGHEIIYTYTDVNGCANADTSIIFVDLCTGLYIYCPSQSVMIYPNPTEDFVTISWGQNSQFEMLRVFDNLGCKIFESLSLKQPVIINLKQFSDGVYLFWLYGKESVKVKVVKK